LHPHPKEISRYKDFWKNSYDVTADAAMIGQLVPPEGRVAIISSFETDILMTAKRRPLFYYSPLIDSRFMQTLEFGGTYLHTHGRLQQFFSDLSQQGPAYIFVENKLFNGQLDPSMYEGNTALRSMKEYLQQNYHVQEQGKYLSALAKNL
jgi:hypothetical protein